MDEALTFSMALTLPAAAAMIAMPFFLTDGLYTRGEFHIVDALKPPRPCGNMAGACRPSSWRRCCRGPFFARQDTRTPMNFAIVSVAVNVIAGIILFHLVGVAGIAAATSLASWVNVLLMLATLARRGAYSPSAAAWSRLARGLLASLLLGALLALAAHERPLIQAAFHGLEDRPRHRPQGAGRGLHYPGGGPGLSGAATGQRWIDLGRDEAGRETRQVAAGLTGSATGLRGDRRRHPGEAAC